MSIRENSLRFKMTTAMTEGFWNCSILTWIGALVVCSKLLIVSNSVLWKVCFGIRELCGFGVWTNLGKWAVVTGGTDGIGRSYAEELAKKGFNICLISRNTEKLINVAAAIENEFGVSTKTIHADFTEGPDIYRNIETQLKELEGEIGVLVNNVGMSYKYAEYFHAVPDGLKAMWNMIYSNVTSCTMMMHIVMPLMKKGIIINVSSLMAVYPMPLLTTYAACKAYVDYLSRAVLYEYKNKGIIIQCVLPAYVATKMSNRRPSLEIPSAKTYVASAIQTVGAEDVTYGYLPHKIRGYVHQWLKANMPARFNLMLSMYFMQKSRESYYRKLLKKEGAAKCE